MAGLTSTIQEAPGEPVLEIVSGGSGGATATISIIQDDTRLSVRLEEDTLELASSVIRAASENVRTCQGHHS